MVLDAVSNFVRGNTDAEVGTEDTTVSVDDASIFPDPETDGEFNVVIWDVNNFPRPDQDGDVEILRVTERDTTDDELTVVRGQETTSAAAHPEGSAIHLSPTAKMFSDIESTFGDFWDAETQELTADVNNTNTTTEALETDGAVIGGTYHYASRYNGSDADARLDNALTAAAAGDIIYLENETYEDNKTIDARLAIVGTAGQRSRVTGSTLVGTWTLSNGARVIDVNTHDSPTTGEIVIDDGGSVVRGGSHVGTVTVQKNDALIVESRNITVVFESETSGGLVDSAINASVTDNGNNTIGDIT